MRQRDVISVGALSEPDAAFEVTRVSRRQKEADDLDPLDVYSASFQNGKLKTAISPGAGFEAPGGLDREDGSDMSDAPDGGFDHEVDGDTFDAPRDTFDAPRDTFDAPLGGFDQSAHAGTPRTQPVLKGQPDMEDYNVYEDPDVEWFVGRIKSYSAAQGYGFIQCAETFGQYQRDVFLHTREVDWLGGSSLQGRYVRFRVEINGRGRPQARNVEEHFADGQGEVDTGTLVGRVKSYSEQKGFGFIECPETRQRYNKDVFLHKKQAEEAGDIKIGDAVTFCLKVTQDGKPQARNVEKIAAPDTPGVEEVHASAFPQDS